MQVLHNDNCNLTFSSVLIVFYSAIDITSPAETPTVGGTATFTCTSLLGQADMIEWLLVDGTETSVDMNSGQSTLDLVLDPVSESMNGGVYRCRVTISGATVNQDITVTVQGELLGSKINSFQNIMGFQVVEKLINAL